MTGVELMRVPTSPGRHLAPARAVVLALVVGTLGASGHRGAAAAGPETAGACAVADPAIVVRAIEPREVIDAGADAALCEPSAVLTAPWDPGRVLVADNERHKQLYLFDEADGTLRAAGALDMPSGNRPRDIEALATFGDAVLLAGSHGANKRCVLDEKRARLRVVAPDARGRLEEQLSTDAAEVLAGAASGVDACLDGLFGTTAVVHAGALCEAIVAGAAGGAPCRALNVEGALVDAPGRVWLGLRAPLVDGHAALVRVSDEHGPLVFDRVVLVDLGGLGVRALARDLDGGRVLGIAGPDVDSAAPFRLFSIPLAALEGDAEPRVTLDSRCLPTSSEGLALRAGRALILVDGAEHDDGARCEVPGGYYTLELPRP